MKGFFLMLEGRVELGWIDESGHMNVMWYTHLFDRGSSLLFKKIGVSTKLIGQECPSLAASRIYTVHRKELLANESWQLWSGLTQIDASGISFSHRLMSRSCIHATCDIQTNAFDLKMRQKTVLTESIIERGREFLVPGLSNNFATMAGRD